MKNQGISLISLIITIIVIIILAAIVIFTGLGTPDSAQLAGFTQQCDNVSSAVLNTYAKLYEKHGLNNEYRTQEQIYMEVAKGSDMSGESGFTRTTVMTSAVQGDARAQLITQGLSAAQTDVYGLNMVLPKVNNDNTKWYVTADGKVFNQTGFQHDNKIYYNGYTYSNSTGTSAEAAKIAKAIYDAKNVVD